MEQKDEMLSNFPSVLIPSAKYVPEELHSLGRIPGIIYPINNQPFFVYLYERYKEYKITVVCYEGKNKIHKSLDVYKNVVLVDLDYLGDLGYSVYSGLKNVVGNVIINFGDTMVFDALDVENKDYFYYSREFESSEWTFFECDNGVLTNIYDKNLQDSDRKRDMFVGVFMISDANALCNCIKKYLGDTSSTGSFYKGLRDYSRKKPLEAVEVNDWLDIGHVDRYFNSKLKVSARNFNHITIDRERGILRKTSENKEKFIDEIKWYLKLPDDIEYIRPRIFSYSTSYSEPYIEMEYYDYHTLHELFLYGNLNFKQWENVFRRINFVLNDLSRYTASNVNSSYAAEKMYLDKTVERLEILRKNEKFHEFFNKYINVNGVMYRSLNDIENVIERSVKKLLYNNIPYTIIHGDLCFSNIMIDSNFSFIKLIDPRGRFGRYDIYGDQRYDIAKLFHSVDGKYDFIIKDKFNLKYNLSSATIFFQIEENEQCRFILDILCEMLKEKISNIKEIELIEALLFISMIPLHSENINHQLVMLGTGLSILDRVVDIKRED